MASLQTESNYWFHYEPEYPSEKKYVPVSFATESSYPSIMIHDSDGDPIVEELLKKHGDPLFVSSYLAYPKRFSKHDNYTLFVPISENNMLMEAHELILNPGKSFRDRENKTYGNIVNEQLLAFSMCPFRITPQQIQGRSVSISRSFLISPDGHLSFSNKKIKYYITLPHAVLFFY
jgi:hypothetical protein